MSDALPPADSPAPPPPTRARRRLITAYERRLRRRKWITYGLAAVSTVLLVHALLGETGYLATIRAGREYDALMDAVVKVRHENQELHDRARRLREDPAALEDAARRDLNLTRPGEVLVIIRDPAPARQPE